MKKKRRQIDKRLKKKLPPAGHRVKKCEGGVEIQLRGFHCRASYAVITPICHDDGDDDDDDDLDDYDLDDYDGDDDDDGDDVDFTVVQATLSSHRSDDLMNVSACAF